MTIDAVLVASAALMGIAGAPHCAAMCGAASGAAVQACSGTRPAAGWTSFAMGRLLGYATAGAVASTAVSLLGSLGESATGLRALWTLLHAAALSLGVWLMVTARQPAWFRHLLVRSPGPKARTGWQPMMAGPARAGLAGFGWTLLPCGLLQSAMVVAALAGTAEGGAAAMAAFSLTSSAGLALIPSFTLRWAGTRRSAMQSGSAWALRLAGLMLVAGSAWALGHGLWKHVIALCAT